ncbi:MAG: HlyD family efflux transporter periplasmic adaptor subunit [Candidatus Faecivicinus sp.]
MRRRKIKGRFFVFLAILLIAIFLIVRPFLNFGSSEDVIFTSTASYQQQMPCVIIRDEAVTESSATVRVEYIANECTEVSTGDTIANLFTTGYSESLLTKLETTRQNIQAYHRTLLGTIVDSDLNRLETIIDIVALDFKNLVTQQTRGNLQTVVEQLETAMVNRQEYLRQNKRDDTKLTQLYEEETSRLNSIQSWRQVSNASADGVVSFYLDGYENDLTLALLDSLSPTDIQTVISGAPLAHTKDVLSDGIYRIVDQDKWYVAVVENADAWNPVVGQEYFLQLEGFEDLSYAATVTNVQKSSGTVLAIFEINQPIGPLLYQRSGKATLSISLSSLAVRNRALYNQNGQIGIWLYDVPGGTFVPVEVLKTEGDISLIQPVVDGSLQPGQRVLIK